MLSNRTFELFKFGIFYQQVFDFDLPTVDFQHFYDFIFKKIKYIMYRPTHNRLQNLAGLMEDEDRQIGATQI